MRDLVAAGSVSAVLAQDRGKFARNPAYLYLLREEFGQYGTVLRDLNDRGDESLAILKLAATFGVEPSELVDRGSPLPSMSTCSACTATTCPTYKIYRGHELLSVIVSSANAKRSRVAPCSSNPPQPLSR